ncbi:hypothetical protein ATANTOWER_010501 [Ataeniobius toweri]|uniref:Uncharacterized protein n=1 Tax=Ataeniobius toweri TaxID=208326 RepID=A0ABU7BX58_9TELE|nr:hypothetical protein [Ataeniobius toweri]
MSLSLVMTSQSNGVVSPLGVLWNSVDSVKLFLHSQIILFEGHNRPNYYWIDVTVHGMEVGLFDELFSNETIMQQSYVPALHLFVRIVTFIFSHHTFANSTL